MLRVDKVLLNGVHPDEYPNEISSFHEAGFTGQMLVNVRLAGYAQPTPLQRAVIPLISAHVDVMLCAPTSSGAHAAFLLPTIDWIARKRPSAAASLSCSSLEPYAIILTPTPYLAVRLFDEGRKYAQGMSVSVALAHDDLNRSDNLKIMKKGCDVIIATPDRLLHFVEQGDLLISRVRFLLLDEADMFADEIVSRLNDWPTFPAPDCRTTVVFSTTFPDRMHEMARRFSKEKCVFLSTTGINDLPEKSIGVGNGSRANVHSAAAPSTKIDSSSGDVGDLATILEKADALLNTTDYSSFSTTYDLMASAERFHSNNAEFLWRFARTCSFYANCFNGHGTGADKERRKALIMRGLDAAKKALLLNDASADVFKWLAVVSCDAGDALPLIEGIREGYRCQEYMDKALRLQPHEDHSLLHFRGRWAYDIAELPWIARKVVSLFSSTPLNDTISDALRYFLEAEKVQRRKKGTLEFSWIENLLYVARCYIQLGDIDSALPYLRDASNLPTDGFSEREKQYLVEVKQLLKKYC